MKIYTIILQCCLVLAILPATAQIPPGVYQSTVGDVHHVVKISDNYFIYAAYKANPAEFIRTLGGTATVTPSLSKSTLAVALEFNSNYEEDSETQLSIPAFVSQNTLHLDWFEPLELTRQENNTQELDGSWLFATRGPDEGQERRGEANTRKTLKYMQDGHFQWVAFDTDGMQFMGTGGGAFTAQSGRYLETITYFSKDKTKVGASLGFSYNLEANDWHHKGNNSKGEPMYEIWSRR